MRNRALKYTIGFAFAGILITVLIAYVERNTLSKYDQDLPYIKLGDDIKHRALQVHLSLEEILAGNGNLNFDQHVMQPLMACRGILQGAYDGKETAIGTFHALENEETKVVLKETTTELDKLINAAKEGWHERTSISSATDSTSRVVLQEFDREMERDMKMHFEKFQSTLDELSESIGILFAEDKSQLSNISWFSIVLTVVVFAGSGLALYRLQVGSDKLVEENGIRLSRQEESVTSLTSFMEAISAGNYSVDVEMEGVESLKDTLIKMRDKLRDNAEDDRKRNWSTTGLAQIGEILRTNTRTTEELYDNILRFVVKYTKSNQGGLFLLNEDSEADKYLELVGCYAFERKKFIKKKVGIGEGLIGQCFLEGQRIYLIEVPHEYITITSGLGGANPNALLIVPLKVNEKIYGVLELATFTRYHDFEIDLVEKLAESIASTISTVRVNESTRVLLERTQQQAEEMRAQEEEMRQNMEELEATQEEMRRKEKHIQTLLDSEKQRNEFNNKSRQVIMELSKNKDILSGNWSKALEKLTGSIGRQLNVSRSGIWLFDAQENLICEKLYQADTGSFEEGLALKESEFPLYIRTVRSEETLIAKDVLSHAALGDYTTKLLHTTQVKSLLNVPFYNEGKVAGIISCEHQYEQKEWNDDMVEFLKSCADLVTVTYNTKKINAMLNDLSDAQRTMQAIIDNLPRAVFWKDKDLRIQGCNKIFAKVAGLSSHLDLIGKTDYDCPWKEHAEAYRADDMAVMKSKIARLDQEERNVNSEGQESWVLTSKVPVMNQQGEVVAVLGMFEDITERKRKEASLALQLKELNELKTMLEKKA